MVMVNQIIHLGVGIENRPSDTLPSPCSCPPPTRSINSFGHRMEELAQQERQELEYKEPNEDQGNFLPKFSKQIIQSNLTSSTEVLYTFDS